MDTLPFGVLLEDFEPRTLLDLGVLVGDTCDMLVSIELREGTECDRAPFD